MLILALLDESELLLSDDLVEAIIDKVRFAGYYRIKLISSSCCEVNKIIETFFLEPSLDIRGRGFKRGWKD